MKIRKLVLFLMLLVMHICAYATNESERVFRTITASSGLADNSAQTIKCTLTGRMTVTTIGNVDFYDGANFTHINSDDEVPYKLEDYQGHYHLYYDDDFHLWLKNTRTVSCVDLNTERFVNNIDSIFRLYGVEGRVDDMFVDDDGNVWMCVEGKVYSRKYIHKYPLKKGLSLQELAVYDHKQLLLFYDSGLVVCYDLKSGKQVYQNMSYSTEDAEIYNASAVLLKHEDGLFMIRNGEKRAILLHYNIPKRTWETLMRVDYHFNNMVVHEGKLYIASEWGYFTYNLSTRETVHYKAVTLQGGRQLETDVNALEFDLQGGMWLGTEKRGLLYAPPLKAPFQVLSWDNPLSLKYEAMMADLEGIYEFKGMRANTMYIDSRKWTWVGTRKGLYLYTTPQAAPVIFSTKNGLMNNVVHGIIEDDLHNIWASTSYGICCIYIVDDAVKEVFYFNENDNVPNETFINAKAMKLDDGTIVMQALDHVIKFQPRDFETLFNREPYQMQPKLTKMLVNGIEVSAGYKINGKVVIENAITRMREINLNYDQNSLSLTFSALNYARPLQTIYRVRVRELSKEWVDYSYYSGQGLVDKRGLMHLPLTGLQPGTYHIEVMTSVVPGKFVGEPYEWVINVNQPWWRTTGIMVILALLVVAMILLNFFVYNRNTRLRMKRASEEGDVIRRIMGFVERCEGFSKEKLAPTQEEIYGTDRDSDVELSADFVNAMLQIIPFIQSRKDKPVTMHMLSNVTDINVIDLYDLMSENIHKSPRVLIRMTRIEQVEKLLRTTNLPLEEIAMKCDFVSPNYMMAKFFHRYRMTPNEYRHSSTSKQPVGSPSVSRFGH